MTWSIKSKIVKDKNVENVPHLEITGVISAYCNIVNMIINKIQEFCINLFQTNHLVNYYKFYQQFLYFQRHITKSFYILKYHLKINIVIL